MIDGCRRSGPKVGRAGVTDALRPYQISTFLCIRKDLQWAGAAAGVFGRYRYSGHAKLTSDGGPLRNSFGTTFSNFSSTCSTFLPGANCVRLHTQKYMRINGDGRPAGR
ncbi:hypothetical protein KCP75_08135 [Salmonella enterica subsp. enterica]|nr:hypothetical protein KCP75_08135 [Salmonella enterica subsp. enterica]